jgi:hypothetical protein
MNHVRYEDGVSWCGQTLDNSFHFKDIEQVTINNLHGERLVCQYCLRAIIHALVVLPTCCQLTSTAQNDIMGSCSFGGTT